MTNIETERVKMTQREKLVELLNKQKGYTLPIWIAPQTIEIMADALIENGVIVPPCKVGDPVYFVFFDDERGIWVLSDNEIKDVCNRGILTSPFLDERENDPEHWELVMFGDDEMFFSREEAEKALKEKTLISRSSL